MTATPRSPHRTPTLVGAGIGLVAFLAVGLLPAVLYGGYAGVVLASGLAGAPVGATAAAKGLIIGGMVIGVAAVAALFAALGAAAGAAVGVLTSLGERREAPRGSRS